MNNFELVSMNDIEEYKKTISRLYLNNNFKLVKKYITYNVFFKNQDNLIFNPFFKKRKYKHIKYIEIYKDINNEISNVLNYKFDKKMIDSLKIKYVYKVIKDDTLGNDIYNIIYNTLINYDTDLYFSKGKLFNEIKFNNYTKIYNLDSIYFINAYKETLSFYFKN